ncbi:MAG: flagellar hook assembly protein FlgD [Treponemataceae bacterium]|nr:flagellar hook assembly protein FlgD [Treponema sp.]MDE5798360.1 flagellar hook assembly protein FlgD [Treponemataceae bacterium]MDE6349478.1 flagellar hook assembly protein FlgD [Treponemataceae bacterium]MDE6706019.1 flagellar hook assembly protein FlgD [Treponemataceae bacterium]MDE7228447.1 flagellar hook assembly protein FlgD [Treponemataceae bacterium]
MMSGAERFKLDNDVNAYNKKLDFELREGRTSSNKLGKDDFLKLLVTQLSNQDPLSPMENTEFIAQMAQFSSLEQMTNMSNNFERLSTLMNTTAATETIGRAVEIEMGDTTTIGVVEAVTREANPQLKVNGQLYDMNRVKAVYGVQ